MADPKPKPTSDAKRDPKGRFTPGCAPGPGRRPAIEGTARAMRSGAYLRQMREAIPPSELVAIALKLVTAAKSGSIASARLLFEHLLPKAADREAIEMNFLLDTPGREPFRVAGRSVAEVDAWTLRQLADLIDEEVRSDPRTKRSATSERLVAARIEYNRNHPEE